SLSSRPSHSRRSANGIVVLLYRTGRDARRALRIAVHDAATDHREAADQGPDLGQRHRERILLEDGEIRVTAAGEHPALSFGERAEGAAPGERPQRRQPGQPLARTNDFA